MSAYDKKLYLLSTIIKQDNLWKELFLESVYFKLDRTYYGHIIDNELIKNALYDQSKVSHDHVETAGVGQKSNGEETSSEEEMSDEKETPDELDTLGSTRPKNDPRDPIIPYIFIRNIIFQRFVVGSLLDLGLNLLMLSFKCLVYKHMVHLITLINVEMKRNKSQRKAASWSGKSKEVIESILMTMGALQFTDTHVLETLSFFDIYQTNGVNMKDDVRKQYTMQLSERSDKMLEYVKDVCVVNPNKKSKKSMEEQVAIMINVYTRKNLYNTSASFADSPEYKKMITSSRMKLDKVFGSTPRVNGMSKSVWYTILHFQENSNL